jgi:hypothetical protein
VRRLLGGEDRLDGVEGRRVVLLQLPQQGLELRREAPPKNPPRCRAVLIDAGIRLWGVPRVFAAAVALSLVAVSDRRIRVDAYRACDDF